ncbi:MAG: hypothetical protein ACFFAJ_12115, partial [Candidatus Hodarchaeota archaeon]
SQNVALVNITWYKFGVYNASYDNYTTLSANIIKKGDLWNYILQVFDGMNYSLPINSSIITILNSLPEITSLGFEDATPTTMVALDATWSYWDYDGDTEDKPAAILEWYRNGIHITGFDNTTLIPAVNTSKNQFWFYKLWVYDGTNYSLLSSSESIQIINTAPIVVSLPLPTNVTRLNGLILSEDLFVSAFQDDDGDSVEIAEIYWYKDTILQGTLNGSFTIQGSLLTKGENWTYAIRPYDGTAFGLIYTSTNITVSNTAPSVISAVLSPSQAKTTDNLEVVINEVFDLDSDPLGPYSILWYKGMVDLQSDFNNFTILPSANTTKGEIWRFEIRVYDGTNWSVPYSSNLVTILNTKPMITNVTLWGGTSTYENLTLTYDFYDVDDDLESGTTITWRYTPGGTGGGYYGLKEINASETKAGQLWWVEILPNDGFQQGDLYFSLNYGITILIGNTAPTINQSDITIKGEFNGTEYSDESFGTIFNLNLRYNASDIDGEEGVSSYGLNLVDGFALGSEYRWYRNRSGLVTLISVLNDQTTVPFYYTEKDDLWWVQVRPRDIYGDFGKAMNSTPIVIGNSYPFVQGFSWLTLNPTMNDNLAFTFDYFDWDDDPVNISQTLVIIQIDETSGGTILKNGTVMSIDLKFDIASNRYYYTITVSLTAGDYHKNDNISVIIRPFDGTNWASENYTSSIISIINSLPLVTGLTLQPVTNENNLSLDWNYFDFDLDPQINDNNIIIWYKNGVEQPIYNSMSAIPLGDISNGDLWRVELQVFDGSNYSVVYSVDIVTKQLSIAYKFDPQTSQVDPDWTLDSREFYVEDENITISYHFSQDDDVIGWSITWFVDSGNGTSLDAKSLYPDFPVNTYTVPHQYTHPGEYWYCEITPFDGIYWWGTIQSREIYIQSRPSIHTDPQEVILALNDTEGHYNLTISATDLLNNIVAVEFTFNDTTIIASDGVQITDDIWTSELHIPEEAFESYLNSVLLGQIKVITTANYNDVSFNIYSILRFNITIEDTAAPRVLDAFFVPNEDVNPTNLTFYAHIQEFGAGVSEINLQYYFESVDNSGHGGSAAFSNQNQINSWLNAQMIFYNITTYQGEAIQVYRITVPFNQDSTSWKVIYRVSTSDNAGNINPLAFDILTRDPNRVDRDIVFFTPPGINPTLVLIIVGVTLLFAFVGSIVYVKFIRKPEIVGLDKELVLRSISEIDNSEARDSLDSHTIGIVISFFDQRHGPIPIIVIPEILRDNFPKLVELSDRSFSGTGFSDNFDTEISSSYDFVLAQGIRSKVMSFGFALDRPNARGGQENLTANILIHSELFPLVNQFLDEIQERVHTIHGFMNSEDSEKENIRNQVFELRKYVSLIILSYERIYGTTELISVED